MKKLIEFSRRPLGLRFGIGALVIGLVAGGTVMASHDFTDVPTTHVFHDQISNLVNAGITTGCAAGLYCPDANVTRAQMAAFLGRGLGRATRIGCSVATVATIETAGNPCSISITPGLPVGAVAGARQIIQATATMTVNLSDATGCPCVYRGALLLTGAGYLVPFYTDVTLTTVSQKTQLAMTGAIATGPGAGPRTVEVRLFRFAGTGVANAYGNVSATVFPFGGTGGTTLGPTEVVDVPQELSGYLTPSTPELE